MKLSFAPMEGISSYIYRSLHARFFGGVEEYFAPFIAPDGNGSFKASSLRDILPENNRDINLVPQLLVNRPEPFIRVAGELAAMGYREVNPNIGCPSATVVAKHKGSGMLLDLAGLDSCLNEIFSRSVPAVSIKTRMGMETTEEFPGILEIYKKYPLKRLIIHARARSGMYKSSVDVPGFLSALGDCPWPVWYNGDIFSPSSPEELDLTEAPLAGLMLGRGAVADPALPRVLSGGPVLDVLELEAFHDALLEAYLEAGYDGRAAMARLKELWFYMLYKFPDSRRESKALLKSQNLPDYRSAASALFRSGKFSPECSFSQ